MVLTSVDFKHTGIVAERCCCRAPPPHNLHPLRSPSSRAVVYDGQCTGASAERCCCRPPPQDLQAVEDAKINLQDRRKITLPSGFIKVQKMHAARPAGANGAGAGAAA